MSKEDFKARPIQGRVLVVDLDDTLVRTDMLYESFWDAVGKDLSLLPIAFKSLFVGRATLKAFLFQHSDVDATTLPYNSDVIAYINEQREQDDVHVSLVTASNEQFAQEVADHLGIFDSAYGSDASMNLKGARKATFLKQEFKGAELTYIGDSVSDLDVWAVTDHAVTVNATKRVQLDAEVHDANAVHLPSQKPALSAYMKALRPHQWLKNILIFLPVLASKDFSLSSLLIAMLAFISFSFVASSVYFFNDLVDLRVDRAHPRKKNRPFASGAVPIQHGSVIAFVLLLFGYLIALTIGAAFTIVLTGYFILTSAYSIKLKRIPVLDIFTLAVLYTARIISGGAATGTEISVWLLSFSIFIFFSLASVKRLAELSDISISERRRDTGRGYVPKDQSIVSQMAISSGYCAALVVMLYVDSASVKLLYNTPEALWGICFTILFWVSRMAMVAHRGEMDDDPIIFAAKDKVSIACVAISLGFAIMGSYL